MMVQSRKITVSKCGIAQHVPQVLWLVSPLLSFVLSHAQTTVNAPGNNNQNTNTNNGIQIQANIVVSPETSKQLREVSRKAFGTESNWEATLVPGKRIIADSQHCVPPRGALSIQLGDGDNHSAAWCTKDSCGVIEGQDTHILGMKRNGNFLVLNAEVFGSDGRILASIEEGKVIVNGNNAFRWNRPDSHTIEVIDQQNQKALSVDFVNPTTVVVGGIFYSKGGGHVDIQSDSFTVSPPGAPQSGVCFGDISEKGWAVWVDPKNSKRCNSTGSDLSPDEVCVGFDTGIEATGEGDSYYSNKDYFKAFDLYQRAAREGNANAMYKLGYMYHTGQGTGRNLSKAFENYSRAATAGEPRSLKQLAQWYSTGLYAIVNKIPTPIDGLLLPKDCEQAKQLYQKAFDRGGAATLDYVRFLLGESQVPSGVVVCPADFDQAGKILLAEVDKGSKEALDYLLKKGVWGFRQDQQDELVKALQGAANRGSIEAMKWLALRASRSNDFPAESKWLNMAIQHGDTSSMQQLGEHYLNGDQVPVDFAKARTLYDEADASDKAGPSKIAVAKWPTALYFQSERNVKILCDSGSTCAKECNYLDEGTVVSMCDETQVTDIGIRLFSGYRMEGLGGYRMEDLNVTQIIGCEQMPALRINPKKLQAVPTHGDSRIVTITFPNETKLFAFRDAVTKACPATSIAEAHRKK